MSRHLRQILNTPADEASEMVEFGLVSGFQWVGTSGIKMFKRLDQCFIGILCQLVNIS